jgi:hypothetical protein
MGKKKNAVLERQLQVRSKLWPNVTDEMLWGGEDVQGFSMVPRVMPLMMSIMDDLSGKGFPVGQTYLELWCRLREERFLTLNRPEEMAFHAGFSGQRALRTWKDRVRRLADLGFIDVQPGPLGDLSYAIFLNPYHILKRHFIGGTINAAKWQALVIRALEIGAYDLDEIDDNGDLVLPPSDDSDDDVKEADGESKDEEPPAENSEKPRTRHNLRNKRRTRTIKQLSEST